MKDVFWTIHPFINPPSAIYADPVKTKSLARCPVVNETNARSRIITSPYHLKISPVWNYVQKHEQYEFKGFNSDSNDLRDDYIWSNNTVNVTGSELWYDQNKAQFQVVIPYIFICPDPLDMTLVGLQSSETRSKLDELLMIGATMDINKMARSLSSAWTFQKMKDTEAEFLKGQPHLKLQFSEKIRLHKFTPGEKFTNWVKVNNGLTNYQTGTSRIFDRIKTRQPKNLYKEVEENVEYSEA
jgi:hypothetical protein